MLQLMRCYWTETKPEGKCFTINCYLHGKHVDLSCTEAKTWPQLHPSDINEKRKTFQGISATLSTSKGNKSFVSSLKIREETFSSRHLHIQWLRSIFNNFAHTTPYKISSQMKTWSSHLLDNLSNCLMNLKNAGDSTGFEPITSAMPVQCSNQQRYEDEATQWRAGQKFRRLNGIPLSQLNLSGSWDNCLNCPASARIMSSFDFKHRTAYNISFVWHSFRGKTWAQQIDLLSTVWLHLQSSVG